MTTVRQDDDRLMRFACRIARADYDLASISNHFDRMTIVANAALLLALAVLATIAWTAFWASFLPLAAALPLGLLVGAIIFGIDQAIAASDWELAGVLRIEAPDNAYWFKASARLVVPLCFLLRQPPAPCCGCLAARSRRACKNNAWRAMHRWQAEIDH